MQELPSLNESESEILELLKERRAKLRAKKNVLELIQYFKPNYIFAKFHQELSQKLFDLESGKIKNLMVLLPPRHFKTKILSVYFVSRIIGMFADRQIMSLTHSSTLADEIGREVRDIVGSPEYKALYGVTLRQDSRAVDRWHTNTGGIYHAAGWNAVPTGMGADWLLMDDPHKDRLEADSDLIRESVITTYKSTITSRCQPGARKLLAMQRWHENDLAGYLKKEMAESGF